ncbi:MAG: hypothetical protein WBK88_01970 [Methanothrix sp.]
MVLNVFPSFRLERINGKMKGPSGPDPPDKIGREEAGRDDIKREENGEKA